MKTDLGNGKVNAFLKKHALVVGGNELFGVILSQVVVWQKAKVPDHRSALAATLGPGVVINLVPCHHRQEQPEVSSTEKIKVR